jgi:hypothetical protein
VADALSRRDAEHAQDAATELDAMCVRSSPTFVFLDAVCQATARAPDTQEMLRRLGAGELQVHWRFDDGLLLHGSRVFLPDHDDLCHQALQLAHAAGHEGVQKTLHRLRSDFYVPGDRALVKDWVRTCTTCQRNKTETRQPAGLLQPLAVPSQVWADIAIDFIEGLPKVAGKSVILTVVDRFSKYTHFIPLGHPYTASLVARAFFDGIVRLHGFPSSIVSDRDPVFTGHVWRDLFGLAGVKLRMSTAFHPQTDGQSEVVNKVIAMYLRCVTGDRPRSWVDWLSWAEYCYNTSFHTALRATPFEVVYGRPPQPILPYTVGSAKTEATDVLLRSRDEMFAEVRQRLLQAQQLSKKYYDESHRDLELDVGAWSGCASSTGPRSRSTPRLGTSWVPDMLARSRCWNVSVRSPTAYDFQRAPGSMTSSTWGCSSPTTESRRLRLGSCRHYSMAALFQSQRLLCAQSCSVACGMFVSSGAGCLTRTPRESRWRSFEATTPISSSRTSCLRRRGEMLWSARTLGGAPDVARGRAWLGQGAKGLVFYFSGNLRGFVSSS